MLLFSESLLISAVQKYVVAPVHPLHVHTEHHALVAVPPGRLPDESGVPDSPGVDRNLVRPAGQHPLEVVQPPDAAPHGEGDENGGGHLGQNIGKELPPLMGRSDVVEHQLVGTGAGVVLRQSHRVGHVPEPLKIDSLCHPSVPYVQAGDDTLGHHVTPPPPGRRAATGPRCKGPCPESRRTGPAPSAASAPPGRTRRRRR